MKMKLSIGVWVILCCCLRIHSADEPPNIVLVMADDQGWGDMAYNGHPNLATPNFDKASKSGIRFDRFYAAAPVCSPTRASVLTGRHPNRMGVFKWGYPMRPQEITLAESLKSVGYTTGHFGKWHLGSVRRSSLANPGRNGFDRWLSAPNFFDNDPILSDHGKAVQLTGESSMVTADAAIDWISEQSRKKSPFLAVVWFGSPHDPHRAIAEDRARYEGHPHADFLGEITGMDRAFGKLRDHLLTLEQSDNTILWYCSDNGALPKKGRTGGFRGNKGKIYEGGLLVPSILEWPSKIESSRVTNVRCNTCDIYPTLLELAGVNVEHQPILDGLSLVPLINGRMEKRSKPMGFWDFSTRGISTPSAKWMGDLLVAQKAGGDLEAHDSSQNAAKLPSPPFSSDRFLGHAAWIDGHMKLHRIENKQNNITWELYNLETDPFEETNLIEESEADELGKTKRELASWLKSVVQSVNGDDYFD